MVPLATAAAIFLVTSGVRAEDLAVRTFGTGADATDIGAIDGSEDAESAGPQAIYSGPNGEVYLLDQINQRVLQFDPRAPGTPPKVLQLPPGLEPTDLIVTNGNIYVWDGQPHALQPTGNDDQQVRGLTLTRGDADETTRSMFAQMGSQPVENEDEVLNGPSRAVTGAGAVPRKRQLLASASAGPLQADFVQPSDVGVTMQVRRKDETRLLASLPMKVRSRLGAVELLDVDKNGRYFVLAENVPTSIDDFAAAFVARYAQNGDLEGIYELPLAQNIANARRFVTVSPDGDVYFLRSRKGGADVLGVGFRQMRKAEVIDASFGQPPVSFSDLPKRKGASAAVRPLTRRQVIETGFAFANVRWRVNAASYGRDPDTACTGFNRIRRPGYLANKVNQEVQGIPYCWGCSGSLAQVANRIERGVLAGNVCTRNDPRKDAAGVDCSAFVSAAWGLQTHFTTLAIPAIAKELNNPWDLLPGDALNKAGSHVVLFVRFTADRKAEVIEASPGACNGRVCRNVYPLSALLARGFKPVRYRGLASDAPVASQDDPAKKKVQTR